MQEVKMAECYFQGDWEENIPEQLLKLLKPAVEPPSWYHSRPKQYSEVPAEEYKEIIKTEEFKRLKYRQSQQLTMSWNDYMELSFIDNMRHQLRADRAFTIKVDQPVADVFSLIESHVALMDKTFKQLSEYSTQMFNEKVGVPNYDSALLKVNQLMLLENCCTDYLQEALTSGWRIISVSPQPDQRRPDYVLGKIVEKPTGTALRGMDQYRCEFGISEQGL
jgi:hypothetical protein